MTRARVVRWVALTAMSVVTAVSLWAWAEPSHRMDDALAAAGEPGAARPAAGAHDAPEEPGAINWTEFGAETPPFLAMLVNFGILIGAYYLLGKKPIAAALQNRRDTIAKEIDEAQRMKREAEERAKTYQAKLETLEEEVRTAREALARTGEAEGERIVKEADAKAERMRKDAEFIVEQEIKQIRLDLWRDAVETAVAAAEEILKQRVTPADQERLAEDHLAELGAPRAAPAPAARESAP